MRKVIITKDGRETEHIVDFAAKTFSGSFSLRVKDERSIYEIAQVFDNLDKIVFLDDDLDIRNDYFGPYTLISIIRTSDGITMKLIKGE